jgi:hypothetical protein
MHHAQAIDVLRDDEAKVHSVLRTFFNIMDRWRIGPEQARVLLGRPSRSQFYNMKGLKVRHLGRDTLERISYVFGIHKALRILFTNTEIADSWIHRPNAHPLFGGAPAIDKLLAGNVADLAEVRRYLDAERG